MSNKKTSILIVDDDPSCIASLVKIVEDDSKTLMVANDGQSAIDAALLDTPDLILMDIDMPSMSGYEILSILKNMNETKMIPVMFITSRDAPQDIERGMNLGAVDYVLKAGGAAVIKSRVDAQVERL